MRQTASHLSLKLATLLLAGSMSLLASSADRQEALGLYNQGNLKQAKEKLLQLVRENPADAELNFYLGRSAMELKDYDTAVAAFDRVLMVNPAHSRTRLEMARVYYEMGYLELAAKELDGVLSGKLPAEVREVAQNFRQRIEATMKRHSFGGAIIVGVEYDDNANNDIGGKSYILPRFQLPITGTKKEKDYALYQGVILNHAYDFGEPGWWSVESSANLYNKSYTDESVNNLSLVSLSTGLAYAAQASKISTSIGYDKVYLESEGYVDVWSASLKLKQIITRTLMGEAGITLRNNDYTKKNRDRDSRDYTTFLGAKMALGGENPWLLSTYITHRQANAKEDKRTDVDLKEWSYRADLSKTIARGLRANLSYVYKTTDYDKRDNLFLSAREDKEHRYEAGLNYELTSQSTVALQYTHIDHKSNHAPFIYKKNTMAAHYIWSF